MEFIFLLDMHQDSMHEFFCGEGLPTWAVKSDGLKNYFGKFPEPLAKPYVEKDANNFQSEVIATGINGPCTMPPSPKVRLGKHCGKISMA